MNESVSRWPISREANKRFSVIDALRRSEQRLSLVLEAADLGFWDWDIRTKQLTWSESCLALYGLPRDTGMTYERFLEALHPDDRERTHQAVIAAIERYRKYDIEMRTIWPDGTQRWIRSRGRAFYSEGEAIRMSGVAWDITEQKHAEEALVRSEHRFRQMAESLPQLVWVTNGVGENTYCNSRLAEYSGRTVEELMGTGWYRVIHPDDLERTIEVWNKSVSTKEPFHAEYRLIRHDGTVRYFLAKAVPLLNQRGEVEQWLGSSTDIHDQKMGEAALRRAEKMAVAGRFATSIAHEINNPLMSVTQVLYLLDQDEELRGESRALLKMAEEELARVARVVAHMLHFKRGSERARRADLREIVESVLVLFSARLANAKVRIEREFAEPAEVVCYRDELVQAISNIISNAYNAMRTGGRLRIRIRPTPGSDGQRGLRMTIADQGKGIPAEARRSLFDSFSETKELSGTGLSLWATAEIVRRHGGRISLRSSQQPAHSGTAISIFLPLDSAELV